MTKKKIKKNNLSLENISKTVNELDKKIPIKVYDRFGNEYNVIVNKYFKKSDVSKVTGILIEIIGQLREKDKDKDIDVKQIIYVYPFLLLKYFTNIPIPDNINEIIIYAQNLIELDVVEQIYDAIPKNELTKVNNWIEETINILPEYVPQLVETMNQNDLIKGIQ